MPNIKGGPNIFRTPSDLKDWAIELSDACGSVIINKKPNVSKVDALIEKFVMDYNENLEKFNGEEKTKDENQLTQRLKLLYKKKQLIQNTHMDNSHKYTGEDKELIYHQVVSQLPWLLGLWAELIPLLGVVILKIMT